MPHLSRAALAALLAAAPLAAQGHDHSHGSSPSTSAAADIARLGRVEFANSGAPAAQPAFLRGMTLLHSFLFDEARAGAAAGAGQPSP